MQGAALAGIHDGQLSDVLGCSSTAQFADLRLDVSRSRAFEMMSIARAAAVCEPFREAYLRGDFRVEAARCLARVILHDGDADIGPLDRWLRAATFLTDMALRLAVRHAIRHGEEPIWIDYTGRYDRQFFDTALRLDLRGVDAAAFDLASRRMAERARREAKRARREADRNGDGARDASDRASASQPEDAATGAPREPVGAQVRRRAGAVAILSHVSERAVRLLPRLGRTDAKRRSNRGASKAAHRRHSAHVGTLSTGLRVRVAPCGPCSRDPAVIERFVLGPLGRAREPGWLVTGELTGALRDLQLELAGHRCGVPGCRSRAAHVHHIHERGRGGDHHPSNLIALCEKDHQWLIHELRRLIIQRVPMEAGVEALRFVRPDGVPIDAPAAPDADSGEVALEEVLAPADRPSPDAPESPDELAVLERACLETALAGRALDLAEIDLTRAALRGGVSLAGHECLALDALRKVGRAPGTVHRDVQLHQAMERFPQVREALASGRVKRSTLTALALVLREETVAGWLDIAARATAREATELQRWSVARPGHPLPGHDEVSRARAARRMRLDQPLSDERAMKGALGWTAATMPEWLYAALGRQWRLLLLATEEDEQAALRQCVEAVACPGCGRVRWSGTHGVLTDKEKAALRCGAEVGQDLFTRTLPDVVAREVGPLRRPDRLRARRRGKKVNGGRCVTPGCRRPATHVHRMLADDGRSLPVDADARSLPVDDDGCSLLTDDGAGFIDVPCCDVCHASAHGAHGKDERFLREAWLEQEAAYRATLDAARKRGDASAWSPGDRPLDTPTASGRDLSASSDGETPPPDEETPGSAPSPGEPRGRAPP